MRPELTATLCTLISFIAGVLVINWQLWNSARNSTVITARESVARAEAILDEARWAADTVMPLPRGRCTQDAQFALSYEAALQPHIRAVALLKGHKVWCSSFTSNYPLAFNSQGISTSSLTLYPGDLVTPGVPLLVWLAPAYGGHVAVSFSDTHLRDALLPIQGKQQLALVVGNRFLSRLPSFVAPGALACTTTASCGVVRIATRQLFV